MASKGKVGSTVVNEGEESEYESFFRYTSGRWLYASRVELSTYNRYNEKQRSAERYLRFNVAQLITAAVDCTGHGPCTSIVKMAEGGASKVFLITMEDGFEVIAKLPTPIAGPAHYLTASEVATMDFLRTELSLPIPHIYGWNSSTSLEKNPVGAEYIIMEKVKGIELSRCWPSLSKKEMLTVIKQLCEYENKLFTTTFEQIGGIYYTHGLSLQERGCTLKDSRWCLGPTPESPFWHGERHHLQLNRGPCTTISHRC
jgi:hypothetical protein